MTNLFDKNKDIVLVLALILFAWIGFIDRYAEAYINSSLVSAGASFGIAKLFNATVSVLSTITLNVPVIGSIQIGELLDPLNDLVEDFSSVMKYAISSLLIQKFLVEILQTIHFKIFLTLSGVAFLFTKYAFTNLRLITYKTFLFAVICKFSIAAVAVASSWVDSAFIDDVVQRENATLEAFPTSPDQLDEAIDLTSEIKEQMSVELQTSQTKYQLLEQQQQSLMLDEDDKQKQVDDINLKLAALNKGRSSFSTIFEADTEEQKTLKAQRAALLSQLERIQDDLEESEENLEDINENIADLQERLNGDISTLEAIKNGFNQITMAAKKKVTDFVSSLNQSMDHFLNLIALFVLKTVIIPLVFLVIMYKVFVKLWGMTPQSAVNRFRDEVEATTDGSLIEKQESIDRLPKD